jgi:hypothetical protein
MGENTGDGAISGRNTAPDTTQKVGEGLRGRGHGDAMAALAGRRERARVNRCAVRRESRG